MGKVTHYDGTDEKGVRRKSIGAAYNDAMRAYNEAIDLSNANGTSDLTDVLLEARRELARIDIKVLDAICDLQ